MHWQKAPPELIEQFERVTEPLLGEPDVARRKMFGYPACFVGGHMFTGLHQDRWVVRLPDEGQDEVRAAGGASFEPMPGRPMRGFVVLPTAVTDDDDAISGWLRQALEHGRSLPAKPGR